MSRILLAVSASAAIHKACDLASKLTQEGHEVRVVLTSNAAELISPQLFEALSGQPAQVSEFGDERRAGMDHIELAKWCELFVFAPATAGSLGRLAGGLAENLVTTVALALPAQTPKLFCPAMNPSMYANPAVRRNIAQLIEDGWLLLEPEAGRLACEDEGAGRLPEVPQIQGRIRELLN
ncbi:MAG: phosphopantothenoylcysteine synthetase/decarboxylase [Planctomycetota bacterium]|jgi:phosphopantothenoylcysteine synthetase/decarboxylase